jgi:hypothetical protein
MEVTSNVLISNFPANLIANQAQQPIAKGYLDVTKPPYSAAGDGISDDTDKLQQAITDGYNCNLIVFLPADKTFLVSKQLECISTKVSRKFAFQLVGSTKGTKKPVIKLNNGSTVAGNVLFNFQYNANGVSTPMSNYGATFRGIDIDMGNNPAVSGISMAGAQHCVIEDVKIYGSQFTSGVWRLPGSGGSVVNLTVVGGSIGVRQDEYRPNPTITGLTLENQSQYGIQLTNCRGPLIITGFKISSSSTNYSAIYLNNTSVTNKSGIGFHGTANLCLTDGSIELSGSTLAINNYAQDVTMNNVYVKAPTIIQSGAGGTTIMSIYGSAAQWKKITSYAFTSSLDKSCVIVNRVSLNNQTANYQLYDPLETVTELPNVDFTKMHSWTKTLSWEDTDMVDIVTDYGATPENVNASDDDKDNFQNAINDVTNTASANYGKTIFIPRGLFHISGPLLLKSGLKMIGAGKFISVIQAKAQWNNSLGAMLQSEDVPTGSLLLSEFAVIGYEYMRFVEIKTPNTLFRNIVTELFPQDKKNAGINTPPSSAYISFSGNAGGKVYSICTDHMISWWETDPAAGVRYPGFHFLSVKNTTKALKFYQLSIEHLRNGPQTMFDHAKNVTIFGYKYEIDRELLNIINSDSIQLIGGSGNYQLYSTNDRAIIYIENSTNILIQNQHRLGQGGTDLTTNWILSEHDSSSGNYGVLMYKNASTNSTATEPITAISKMKILSNRATNEYFISGVARNEIISVYNSMGVNVWNGINYSDNSNVELNTKCWKAGIYMVKVNNGSVKFIKAN